MQEDINLQNIQFPYCKKQLYGNNKHQASLICQEQNCPNFLQITCLDQQCRKFCNKHQHSQNSFVSLDVFLIQLSKILKNQSTKNEYNVPYLSEEDYFTNQNIENLEFIQDHFLNLAQQCKIIASKIQDFKDNYLKSFSQKKSSKKVNLDIGGLKEKQEAVRNFLRDITKQSQKLGDELREDNGTSIYESDQIQYTNSIQQHLQSIQKMFEINNNSNNNDNQQNILTLKQPKSKLINMGIDNLKNLNVKLSTEMKILANQIETEVQKPIKYFENIDLDSFYLKNQFKIPENVKNSQSQNDYLKYKDQIVSIPCSQVFSKGYQTFYFQASKGPKESGNLYLILEQNKIQQQWQKQKLTNSMQNLEKQQNNSANSSHLQPNKQRNTIGFIEDDVQSFNSYDNGKQKYQQQNTIQMVYQKQSNKLERTENGVCGICREDTLKLTNRKCRWFCDMCRGRFSVLEQSMYCKCQPAGYDICLPCSKYGRYYCDVKNNLLISQNPNKQQQKSHLQQQQQSKYLDQQACDLKTFRIELDFERDQFKVQEVMFKKQQNSIIATTQSDLQSEQTTYLESSQNIFESEELASNFFNANNNQEDKQNKQNSEQNCLVLKEVYKCEGSIVGNCWNLIFRFENSDTVIKFIG